MQKYIKYIFVFIFMLFITPIDCNASNITYGISSIKVNDSSVLINGWGYITFQDFCNIDNLDYINYNMMDSEGNLVGQASRCAGKGFNTAIYVLSARPDDGNASVVYASNKSGNTPVNIKDTNGNLRLIGTSATCVNYYKPATYIDGVRYSIHCDGAMAPSGVFPSDPINYAKRNYNVQNYDKNFFYEGAYFYDDIGFAGQFNLSEFQEGVQYTIWLNVTVNGKTYSQPIAAPGIVVSAEGTTYTKTSEKLTITSEFNDILFNYSPNKGTVNQDAGGAYMYDDGFRQPGGYFTQGKSYTLNKIVTMKDIVVGSYEEDGVKKIGNKARIGGFDLYNLGTTGTFSNGYTTPGSNYNYYALSTWVDFSGKLIIQKKSKVSNCGNTLEGTSARVTYCSQKTKPSDYDTCCVCGGTLPNTSLRTTYCSKNPSDYSCCSTGGNCPIETDDIIDEILPDNYTFWNNANSNFEITNSRVKNELIIKNSKYCSNDDITSTIFSVDNMLDEHNNVFCYQVGGFTILSPDFVANSNDVHTPFSNYFLTYSGGNYKLNVKYDTKLVCVSLDHREIVGVSIVNSNGDCVESNDLDDPDIHFLEYVEEGGVLYIEPDDDLEKNDTEYKSNDCYFDGPDTIVVDDDTPYCAPSNFCYSTYHDPYEKNNFNVYYDGFKVGCDAQEITGYDSNHLNHHEYGNFDILNSEVLKEFEEVPQLEITDSTVDGNSNSDSINFEVSINKNDYSGEKIIYETAYLNDTSEMKDYLDSNNISSPLDNETSSYFIKKITVKKFINYYNAKSITPVHIQYGAQASDKFISDQRKHLEEAVGEMITGNSYRKKLEKTISYTKDNFNGTLNLKYVKRSMSYSTCNSKGACDIGKSTEHELGWVDYWYYGWVSKTIYVTVKSVYKEQSISLTSEYSLPLSTVSDRFAYVDGKWVSQINLSDYYQITVDSSNYDVSTGNKFGVAGTWNMDKALCALDVTDHPCDPSEETCACKYDNQSNLEKGVYYSECLDFRIVSLTSLFPGSDASACINPSRNCRQPGRNWEMYRYTGFIKSENIDYIGTKPMYHIVLTPATMNKIVANNKDYYTGIDLDVSYNPSKCSYNGSDYCTSDYESEMLNNLGTSVFTRNRDIINTRYRQLRLLGVNKYETSKNVMEGG